MNSASVRNYCIKNNLFTNGDCGQYAKTLEAADVTNNYHNVAVMIWICSKTDKTINDIENDLRRMDE